MSNGLTQEEAVAVALWNRPSFQATLVDLGLARPTSWKPELSGLPSSRCCFPSDRSRTPASAARDLEEPLPAADDYRADDHVNLVEKTSP
jgi:hypothetical protein